MMNTNELQEVMKGNPTTEELKNWIETETKRFYNDFDYLETLNNYKKELTKELYLGNYGWKIVNGQGTKESIKAELKRKGFYMDYVLDWYLNLRFN